MIDISNKRSTYRQARATATVTCAPETIAAIRSGQVPKGDVLEISRAAGLFAIKKTPELLPFCHPIPVEHSQITYDILNDHVRIEVYAATIYKTGIEVEAMTAAGIVALSMYDMLKPIDDDVRIGEIRVIEKSGGKGDYRDTFARSLGAAVLICSDAVTAGQKDDMAGALVADALVAHGLDLRHTQTVPDEIDKISDSVRNWADSPDVDVIMTVGGTGLGPRDVTVEAVRPLLDREIPGIAESMRQYGLERTPYAALSRGIAGHIGTTLVITLPGSSRGAAESLDALMPWVLHIIKVFDKTYRHSDSTA